MTMPISDGATSASISPVAAGPRARNSRPSRLGANASSRIRPSSLRSSRGGPGGGGNGLRPGGPAGPSGGRPYGPSAGTP